VEFWESSSLDTSSTLCPCFCLDRIWPASTCSAPCSPFFLLLSVIRLPFEYLSGAPEPVDDVVEAALRRSYFLIKSAKACSGPFGHSWGVSYQPLSVPGRTGSYLGIPSVFGIGVLRRPQDWNGLELDLVGHVKRSNTE